MNSVLFLYGFYMIIVFCKNQGLCRRKCGLFEPFIELSVFSEDKTYKKMELLKRKQQSIILQMFKSELFA